MIIAHEGVVISSRNAPWQGLGAGMNINDGKNSLPSMSAEWRANGQQTHAAPTHAGIDPRPEILDLFFFSKSGLKKRPKNGHRRWVGFVVLSYTNRKNLATFLLPI